MTPDEITQKEAELKSHAEALDVREAELHHQAKSTFREVDLRC
jgi:hypothetical protein